MPAGVGQQHYRSYNLMKLCFETSIIWQVVKKIQFLMVSLRVNDQQQRHNGCYHRLHCTVAQIHPLGASVQTGEIQRKLFSFIYIYLF